MKKKKKKCKVIFDWNTAVGYNKMIITTSPESVFVSGLKPTVLPQEIYQIRNHRIHIMGSEWWDPPPPPPPLLFFFFAVELSKSN